MPSPRLAAIAVFVSVPLLALGAVRPAEETKPPTYHARCAAFWEWFAKDAEANRDALLGGEASKVAAFQRELGARLRELVPGMSFTADVGDSARSVRLNLEPGRDRTRQILGCELAGSMPTIAGWECVPWRPPADVTRPIAMLGKVEVFPREFLTYCEWDGEKMRLSIAVWHEALAKLGSADAEKIAGRFVERMLGAAMSTRVPHVVSLLESAPDAAAEGVVAGDELRATLVEFLAGEKFDAASPPERVEEYYGTPSGQFEAGTRLSDVLSGASRFIDLVGDFNLALGTGTVDALRKSGAGAGYVGFTHSAPRIPLDEDSAAAWNAVRTEVGNALDAKLTAAHAGTVVGWAEGRERVWIDLVYFDEAAAREIVRTVLADESRVTAAQVYAFDRARTEALGTVK